MLLLLLQVLLCVGAVLAQPGAPPTNATICATALFPDNYLVAGFATRHFAPAYPQTSWAFKLIVAVPTRRDLLFAFLANGTDCDVLIGPGFSSYAVAFSPLIPPRMIWLNPSATSTELSNKAAHPSFSRTIPTDDVNAGALAIVAREWGWAVASVLCLDDPYGRSVAQGFSTAFTANGGTIELSRCYNSDSANETVKALLDDVLAADSRVLFVASSSATLNWYIEQTRAYERLILLFPEGSCGNASLTRFPGSICATYEPDPSYLTFEQAYMTRTDRSLVNQVVSSGFGSASRENRTRPYGPFAADSVHLAMDSITSYYTSANRSAVTLTEWTRRRAFDGFSGRVVLNNVTGDRIAARLAVFNGRPATDGGWQVIGHVSNGRYVVAPPSSSTAATGASAPTSASGPYWLGSFYSHTPPSGMRPLPEEKKAFPFYYIIAGAIVLLAIVAYAVVRARRAAALAKWPTDAAKPFAVMFVGTKNEALAAELYPHDIARAQAAAAKAVKQTVAKHDCVEARRVGDGTVMIVSKSPYAALRCATAIVDALDQLDWPSLLPEDHRITRTRGRAGVDRDDKISHRSTQSRLSQHSRVSNQTITSTAVSSAFSKVARLYPNIGIHYGAGNIDHDEDRNVFSYHGEVVTVAAEVADNAIEQHILVTDAVISFLDTDAADVAEAMQTFATITLAAKSTAQKAAAIGSRVPTFSYLPDGCARSKVLARLLQTTLDNRAKRKEDAAGSVAGALMAAETGVSQRRIAVVHLHVPALLNESGRLSRDEHQKRIMAVMETVADIVKLHRGHIEYVHDAVVVASVNARGKATTAVPVSRAAAIALDVDEEVATLMNLQHVTAGVATSTAMIGTCHDVHVCVGSAATYAAQLCKAARRMDVRALTLGEAYSDLFTVFSVTTVDIAGLASPAGIVRRARIVSINQAREKELDGEWLYNVTTNANSTEELFKKVQHNQLTDEDREARPAPPVAAPDAAQTCEERAEAMAAERVAAAITHGDIEDYARSRAAELGIGASF